MPVGLNLNTEVKLQVQRDLLTGGPITPTRLREVAGNTGLVVIVRIGG